MSGVLFDLRQNSPLVLLLYVSYMPWSLTHVLRWSMVPPQGVLYPMTVPQPCLGVACIQFCLSAVYMGRSPGHLVISGTGVPAQYPQTPRPPARGVLCPASLASAHPSQQTAARLTRSQTLSLMTMKMNHWQFGGDQSCNNVSCNELDEARHQKAAT